MIKPRSPPRIDSSIISLSQRNALLTTGGLSKMILLATALAITAPALVSAQSASQPALSQYSQQGDKLVGSLAVGPAEQGWSVALSADGNTAIVGGLVDRKLNGAAWIYTRSGDVWMQQGHKLVGSGVIGQAGQGISVALSADGNIAVVGGPYDNRTIGAVWVYTRANSIWSQEGLKLVGSGAIGKGAQGSAVAISADGNTALIGGPYDNQSSGAAWVYVRSHGSWIQQGDKLVGSGAIGAARQGNSVALSADGNTAIVGAAGDNRDAGAAWLYARNDGVWSQQGEKLVGTGAIGSAAQGHSVALSADGNTAIVSGPHDDGSTGAAWVFARRGASWTQEGNKLVGTGAAGSARQGSSVALSADGNTAIMGGIADDRLKGAAWVHIRRGGAWSEPAAHLGY